MRKHLQPVNVGKLRGVTLVELIVAIAILAILISVAVPSFREMSLRNRASSAANSLLADLALARNEAVKAARAGYVSARGDWDQGWIVWVDANGDGSRGSDEPILRQQDPVDPSSMDESNKFSLAAVSGLTGGGENISSIAFASLGQIRVPDDGARIAICRPDGDREKSVGIRVDLSGRAQSVRNLTGIDVGCS